MHCSSVRYRRAILSSPRFVDSHRSPRVTKANQATFTLDCDAPYFFCRCRDSPNRSPCGKKNKNIIFLSIFTVQSAYKRVFFFHQRIANDLLYHDLKKKTYDLNFEKKKIVNLRRVLENKKKNKNWIFMVFSNFSLYFDLINIKNRLSWSIANASDLILPRQLDNNKNTILITREDLLSTIQVRGK